VTEKQGNSFFPCVELEPPMFQVMPIVSAVPTVHCCEEIGPVLTTFLWLFSRVDHPRPSASIHGAGAPALATWGLSPVAWIVTFQK